MSWLYDLISSSLNSTSSSSSASRLSTGTTTTTTSIALASTSSGSAKWLQLWFLLVSLAVLAYLSNPSPATFRTHLTSLSFHTHLRRLSSSSPASSFTDSSKSDSTNGNATTGGSSTLLAPGKDALSRKSDSKSPHVLSFSNRISLSVRTPLYHIRSYGLFSVVVMPLPPLATSCARIASFKSPATAALASTAVSTTKTSPTRRKKATNTDESTETAKTPSVTTEEPNCLRAEVWIGAFGRWFAWKWDAPNGLVMAEPAEDEHRRARVSRGVVKIKTEEGSKKSSRKGALKLPSAVDVASSIASATAATSSSSIISTSDPSNAINAPPLSPTTRISRNSRPTKRPLKPGQRRTSPASLARLRSKVEAAAADKTANTGNNKNALGATVGVEEGKTGSSDRSEDTVPTVQLVKEAENGTEATDSGAAGDEATGSPPAPPTSEDRVIRELQLQVEELRTTTDESERRLQDELEVLRIRKKDEDAFRQELKQKTKVLEEQKRVAEMHRIEAERELNERKSVVRGAQERVNKMRAEIREMEKKELEIVERREKKKRDRKEKERKLKEDLSKRKEELKTVEEGVDELSNKVAELVKRVDQRRDLLQLKRNDITARNMGLTGMMGQNHLYPYGSSGSQGMLMQPGGRGGHLSGWRGPPPAVGYNPYGIGPYSTNNSRPGSVRSGHFDHHQQQHSNYQSAPSSPVQSNPVSPLDHPSSNVAHQKLNDPASATGYYGAGTTASSFLSDTYRPSALSHQSGGFLEHRLQHRQTLPASESSRSSAFMPFDFDSLDSMSLAPGSSATTTGGATSRPASTHSPNADDLTSKMNRPSLALPMQYLDSGLLANDSDSPSLTGPLSPMTPHQTSLIPSQLFSLLDDDEDDDAQFVMPESPTIGAGGDEDTWKSLKLDLDDEAVSRRKRGDSKSNEDAEEVLAPQKLDTSSVSTSRTGDDEAWSPVIKSPSSDTGSVTRRNSSTTTSPITTAATNLSTANLSSPFSPWDASTHSDNLLTNRPSPIEPDDLPRAGLSLNPDAKAFAFSPRAASATIPTSSSSSLVLPTMVKSRSSSNPLTTSTSLNSFDNIIAPPSKSRMNFGHRASSSGGANIGNGILATRSRFGGFDAWSTPASTHSSLSTIPADSSDSSAAKMTTTTTTTSGFNPFDLDDDLLGPLKK